MSQILLVPWRGQADLPEADALLLHAYALHEASTCPACGGLLSECGDPEQEWRVDDSRVCRRTVALEEWKRAQGKDMPAGVLPAVLPVVAGEAQSSQAALLAALRSAESRTS